MIQSKTAATAAKLSLVLLLSTATTFSQTNKSSASQNSGEQCFDGNTKILNVGLGLGATYYNINRGGGYTYRRTPAFSVTYEQALRNKVGPGYIGVGGYIGFQSARWRYNDYYYAGNRYYYQHRWNYTVVAARGAYHFDVLNSKKAELYFGTLIGLRIQTYKYETNSTDPNRNLYELKDQSIYPTLSLFAGGRWYFAQRVALYGEIGYGVSYLTAGLSFKF